MAFSKPILDEKSQVFETFTKFVVPKSKTSCDIIKIPKLKIKENPEIEPALIIEIANRKYLYDKTLKPLGNRSRVKWAALPKEISSKFSKRSK